MEKKKSNATTFRVTSAPMVATGIPFTVIGLATSNATFLIVGAVFLAVGLPLGVLGFSRSRGDK